MPRVISASPPRWPLFLVQTGDVTDARPGRRKPLFALYRRQLLTVPNAAGAGRTTGRPRRPSPRAHADLPRSEHRSPTAGEASAARQPDFNSLIDLTMPVKRFWMNRGNLAGVVPGPAGNTSYATMGEFNPLPGRRSVDDRRGVLRRPSCLAGRYGLQAMSDPQVQTLNLLALANPNRPDRLIPDGKWYFPANNTGFGGAAVFDTWSTLDPSNAAYNYTNWQTPGATPASRFTRTSPAADQHPGDPDHAAGLGFQDEKDPSGDDRAADVSARRSQRPPAVLQPSPTRKSARRTSPGRPWRLRRAAGERERKPPDGFR